MNERDSSQLIWAIAIVGLVSFGSLGLVWSTGGPLPSKAQAEVPKKVAKAEATSALNADAVAGLDKRVLHLESEMKAQPTLDTSQLEAQLKDLGSRLATVQTQLGAFRASDFNTLETKIDSLKTKVDSAGKANSESVKTTIDALQTDVGNLHKRFDQLSQQVASVTAPDEIKHSSQKHSRSR